MKKTILAALVAGTLAAPAFAQNSGARIEARIGYERVNAEVTYVGPGGFRESDGKGAFAYGLEAGYDADLGGAIVGAYAGADLSTVEVCDEVYGLDEACVRSGRNFTAGIRAGGNIGQSLLYAKGGYSNGRVRLVYSDFEGIIPNIREGENRNGWHIGAGLEMPFSQNTYFKAEYVYTNYSDFRYSVGAESITAGLDRHQGLVGIGIRF